MIETEYKKPCKLSDRPLYIRKVYEIFLTRFINVDERKYYIFVNYRKRIVFVIFFLYKATKKCSKYFFLSLGDFFCKTLKLKTIDAGVMGKRLQCCTLFLYKASMKMGIY